MVSSGLEGSTKLERGGAGQGIAVPRWVASLEETSIDEETIVESWNDKRNNNNNKTFCKRGKWIGDQAMQIPLLEPNDQSSRGLQQIAQKVM